MRQVIFGWYSYLNEFFIMFLNTLPPPARKLLFKMILGNFGKKSFIDYKFYFRYPKKIIIGRSVQINRGFQVYPSFMFKNSRIIIRDYVIIAPNVCIIGAGQSPVNKLIDISGDIEIGEGVYIGANSIIRYGVKIGKNSVIGTGAVVVADIPANSIAVGIPAKVISSF